MMYTNLKELVKKQYEGYKENAVKALTAPDTSDSRLQSYLTATRWTQYRNGIITKDQAVEYAVKREGKKLDKTAAAKIAKLDRIAAAPEVKSVSISVEWVRNRTWGYNPTATVTVETSNGYFTAEGRASGCGYDKRTAAIGSALNEIDAVLKMLCDCKENAINNGMIATGTGNESNRNFIAYGAGYGAIPYFEGGVGMSSFESVFNACGYIMRHFHETKTTDYYFFDKKEVA